MHAPLSCNHLLAGRCLLQLFIGIVCLSLVLLILSSTILFQLGYLKPLAETFCTLLSVHFGYMIYRY